MGEWKEVSWGDIATLEYGKALRGYQDATGDVRVFGTNGPVGWTSEAQSPGPGVIIGRKGAYRGVHYTPGPFWVIDTAYYLKPKERLDLRWAYYALKRQDINSIDSGSAIPSTSRADFYALRVKVPPFVEQQAIAAVLGALDDKIAVNERIARTSLDLADAHFELVARNLAYSSETFGSVAEVFGGGTPRTSEPAYWDGSIAWATPSDVTGLSAPYLFTTARKITEKGLAECASQLYPPGSIFMTSRATIGAFAVPQVPTAVNQGFIVVIPRQPEMRWWLFHEMRSRVDEMRSLANGSTFLELSRKNFKAMRVRLAEPDVIARFSAQVDPLHKRAAKCVEESHVLAELRDTLLPKLMSGEIRVRDAEKAVEESL